MDEPQITNARLRELEKGNGTGKTELEKRTWELPKTFVTIAVQTSCYWVEI